MAGTQHQLLETGTEPQNHNSNVANCVMIYILCFEYFKSEVQECLLDLKNHIHIV